MKKRHPYTLLTHVASPSPSPRSPPPFLVPLGWRKRPCDQRSSLGARQRKACCVNTRHDPRRRSRTRRQARAAAAKDVRPERCRRKHRSEKGGARGGAAWPSAIYTSAARARESATVCDVKPRLAWRYQHRCLASKRTSSCTATFLFSSPPMGS